MKDNPLLAEAEALEKCRRVIELICEKCIKQQDMNEVLAVKMHYISCVLGKCVTFLRDGDDKLDGLIKRLVHVGHVCPTQARGPNLVSTVIIFRPQAQIRNSLQY